MDPKVTSWREWKSLHITWYNRGSRIPHHCERKLSIHWSGAIQLRYPPGGNKMIRIKRLDVIRCEIWIRCAVVQQRSGRRLTDFYDPLGDRSRTAGRRRGKTAWAPQIITELPTENGRVVGVSWDYLWKVILESIDNSRVSVERIMSAAIVVSNIEIDSTYRVCRISV